MIPTKKEIKLVITILSIGNIIWGVVTFDWFYIVFGVALFLGSFLFYYFKQRKYLKDDVVYTGYKIITDIKNITKIHAISDDNYGSICLLFYVGLISGAINQLRMSNDQSLNLSNAIFHDLDIPTKDKSDQLLAIMLEAANNDENMKIISFGMETFILFVNLGKTSLSETKEHLMNDFGIIDFKL